MHRLHSAYNSAIGPKRKKEDTHLKIDDRLYGSVVVNEPALAAVIDSAAVQRLRGVLQHGVTALIGITRPLTRYEHSVGVMLLVRRMGGRLASSFLP